MSIHDVNDHDDSGSAVLTVALIGGGAVLLWLFLRGRGKGWGWGGTGSDGGQTHSGSPPRVPAITIQLREGDRIEVDRIPTDFATMLVRARAASQVHLYADGMVRTGFLSKILYALLDENIDVQVDPEIKHRTPRFDAQGRVINERSWAEFVDAEALERCLRTQVCRVALPPERQNPPAPATQRQPATQDPASSPRPPK